MFGMVLQLMQLVKKIWEWRQTPSSQKKAEIHKLTNGKLPVLCLLKKAKKKKKKGTQTSKSKTIRETKFYTGILFLSVFIYSFYLYQK